MLAMQAQSDMERILAVAEEFLNMEIIPMLPEYGLISHPFFNMPFVPIYKPETIPLIKANDILFEFPLGHLPNFFLTEQHLHNIDDLLPPGCQERY